MRKTIRCQATRNSEMWVAGIPQHGVYGYGDTLRALQDNLTQGLALAGVTTRISITPVSPELLRLQRAKDAYETAIEDAVTTLSAHGATPRDVAEAIGVTTAEVTALLNKPRAPRARTPSKRKT